MPISERNATLTNPFTLDRTVHELLTWKMLLNRATGRAITTVSV